MVEDSQAAALKESQMEMARMRTLLAMDRTLLAWVRTSLSLCAFGFTLAKIVHSLIQSRALQGLGVTYPKHVGEGLMVLGIVGLLAGAFDYWRSLRRLQKSVHAPRATAVLILAVVLALVILSLLICLVHDINQL